VSDILANGEWARWFTNNAYAEWYMNSMRIPGSPTYQHHTTTYGAKFAYGDFIPAFNQATERWDPNAWADLFQKVGARYVVLTTKHHDGFLLWPSRQPNPFKPGYHARRDLVGDLTSAVRNHGMKMALYYSGGLDWTFNDQVILNIIDLMTGVPQSPQYVTYANNHWRELIDRYQPCILWNDIAYPAAADLNQLFADYYNAIPDGLVNDRFLQRPQMDEHGFVPDNHYDFRTPEYTSFKDLTPFKWESTRGIGASFGYNRNEGPQHYQSVENLVRSFIDIVSTNGNLLLNVGPMADGTLPDLQRERLLGLGEWLAVNGEAIFSTRPWVKAEGSTREGTALRFTQKGNALYAILMEKPGGSSVTLQGIGAVEGTTVSLLGDDKALAWQQIDGDLAVVLPGDLSASPAYALKITPRP
jgi:alpha-L-fucosidase